MIGYLKQLLKGLRRQYLLLTKYRFKQIGHNLHIGRGLTLRPNTVTVGNDVFIGNYCHLAVHDLVIEDKVLLAGRVGVVGGDHRFDIVGTPIRDTGRDQEKSVLIKKDAWIGFNATILHGVTIGEGAIVAANSLVLKDVPPYTIYGGQPAKFLKNRFPNPEDAIKHSQLIDGTFHKEYHHENY